MTDRLGIKFSLAQITTVFILFLVVVSGYFTMRGLGLAYDDPVLAFAIALAIQGTIFITLVYFPQLTGLGRLIALVTYGVAAVFSVVFAFIYLYATGYGDAERARFLRTAASDLQGELAAVEARETEALLADRAAVADHRARMRAEYETGSISGRGPGEGPVYFRLRTTYEESKARLDLLEREYSAFQAALAALAADLGAERYDTATIATRLSTALRHCRSCPDDGSEAQRLIALFNREAGYVPSSFEAAFEMLVSELRVKRVWVTLVQASLFDFLALFVGAFRVFLIADRRRPPREAPRRRRARVLEFLLFLRRWRIQRARLGWLYERYVRDHAALRTAAAHAPPGVGPLHPPAPEPVVEPPPEPPDPRPPVDPADDIEWRLSSFVRELLSTCLSVSWRDRELLEPIKAVIQKIQVQDGQSVLPRVEVRYNNRLSTVVGVLVGHGVLIGECDQHWVVNRTGEARLFVDAFYRIAAADPDRALALLRSGGHGGDDDRPTVEADPPTPIAGGPFAAIRRLGRPS